MLTIPILMFPPAFVLNKWLIGKDSFLCQDLLAEVWLQADSTSSACQYSIQLPFTSDSLCLSLVSSILIWLLIKVVLQENLGDDGTYIRSMLVTHKPGLWAKISKQLGKLGFDFPEMNDAKSALEFPQGEVWQKIGWFHSNNLNTNKNIIEFFFSLNGKQNIYWDLIGSLKNR